MNRFRFEKFEMKYGYFLPNEFKDFMKRFGGDTQFGSCNFEYTNNITNNLLRVHGKMDFHLLPFGIVGNGDYYCFYRYGEDIDDYFIGIWLHETNNFIILCKTFKSFIYRCALDDYFATTISNEKLEFEENVKFCEESLKRFYSICDIYGFDINKIKTIKTQIDYHKVMIEFDPYAVQSLCYLGKYYLDSNKNKAIKYLESVKKICDFYTAPYYILGKYYIEKGMREGKEEITNGIKTSLVLTGFSYWEEDFIDIPSDVHRNMIYYLKSINISEKEIVLDKDPYSVIFRLKIAQKLRKQSRHKEALREYSNALFCCDDNTVCKDILREALHCSEEGGLLYLYKLIEKDIRLMK